MITNSRDAGPATERGQAKSGVGIEVTDVSVEYRTRTGSRFIAVDNMNLSVSPGEFVSIVGPTGCGKTTIMMAIAGLLPVKSGRICVDRREVKRPQPRETSVVFQDSNLLSWRTVLNNVALPLEVSGVPKAERLERARQVLTIVGLEHVAGHYPRQLSGGMRHRVAVARGLVTDPSLFLMDEPFAALDEITRYSMGEELLKIWERRKPTMIFVTHSLSEAVFLSDRVVVLGTNGGKIRGMFPVDFPRPRSLELMDSAEFASVRGQVHKAIRQ
jgi:NitT/TauT family transport system ATP-binding protein